MDTDEVDYEALAERLTNPATEVRPGETVLRGAEAAAAGRAMMLEAYGSEEALEAAMVRPGRPRIGAKKGPSPTVRTRVSEEDFALFAQLRQETGRTEAELLREAVHLLLVQHKIAS